MSVAAAEDLELIASLALLDIDRVQGSRKGKALEGAPLTDEELAFQLFAEEANSLLVTSRDAVLAESIDSALRSDRALLRAYANTEAQESRDRTMALSLSGQSRVPSAPVYSTPGSPALHLIELVESLAIYASDEENKAVVPAGASSSRAGSSRVPAARVPSKPAQNCVICTDPIRGPEVRAPCGHFYDVSCLVELFRGASVDESLFPPRCCNQPFVLQDVRRFLGEGLAKSFQTKALEFGTANRVYCHRPSCSAFLGAATPTPTAYWCSKCLSHTCGQCKQANHSPSSCDTERDREVLALAAQEGWRRCPGCSHLVELAYGCYHMTCRCRKQFCYVCGANWKTCSCPQWEERRLLNAATVRVERQMPRAANAPAVDFGRMVREEAERLRTNHDCAHNVWRYRSGGGRCESCSFMLPQYLFRCTGCQMLACNRCRRNRL